MFSSHFSFEELYLNSLDWIWRSSGICELWGVILAILVAEKCGRAKGFFFKSVNCFEITVSKRELYELNYTWYFFINFLLACYDLLTTFERMQILGLSNFSCCFSLRLGNIITYSIFSKKHILIFIYYPDKGEFLCLEHIYPPTI